jgi:hypothetical protein
MGWHALTVAGMTSTAVVPTGPPMQAATGGRLRAFSWLAVVLALTVLAALSGVWSSPPTAPGTTPGWRAPTVQPGPPSSEQVLSSQAR